MRFLIDESADARVAAHLGALGHDVTTVAGDLTPGLSDEDVLAIALAESRILITDDSDFGELVFQEHRLHAGVIFCWVGTSNLTIRLNRLNHVLTHHANQLDHFLVVTRHSVRICREIP